MLDSIQAGDVVEIGDEVYAVYDMADSQRGRVLAERESDGKLVKLNVETFMSNSVKVSVENEGTPSWWRKEWDEAWDEAVDQALGVDAILEPRYEVEEYEDDKQAVIYQPHHYADREVEAIDVIEAIIDGLPAKEGMLLSHVLRYALRAGVKTPDWTVDTGKANNYAHRLITGEWRK